MLNSRKPRIPPDKVTKLLSSIIYKYSFERSLRELQRASNFALTAAQQGKPGFLCINNNVSISHKTKNKAEKPTKDR